MLRLHRVAFAIALVLANIGMIMMSRQNSTRVRRPSPPLINSTTSATNLAYEVVSSSSTRYGTRPPRGQRHHNITRTVTRQRKREYRYSRTMRSVALWGVSSFADLADVVMDLPRRQDIDLCVEYEMSIAAGVGNQIVTHAVAAVAATLLGANYIRVPAARGRDRADKIPSFTDIDNSEVLDVAAHHQLLRQLHLEPVSSCPTAQWDYVIPTISYFHGLEKEFEEALTKKLYDWEHPPTPAPTSPQPLDNATASATTGPLSLAPQPPTGPLRYVRVVPGIWSFMPEYHRRSFMWSFFHTSNVDIWPTKMFEAILPKFRFVQPPFAMPKPYGVFHLRAEADNLWLSVDVQLEKFKQYREKWEKTYGPTQWYVASGIFHSQKFDKVGQAALWDKVQKFRAQNPFKTAEDFDPTLRQWSMERRASMDYSLGLEAAVVVSQYGTSYGALLSQLRWIHKPFLPTYVLNPPEVNYVLTFPITLVKEIPDEYFRINDVKSQGTTSRGLFPWV